MYHGCLNQKSSVRVKFYFLTPPHMITDWIMWGYANEYNIVRRYLVVNILLKEYVISWTILNFDITYIMWPLNSNPSTIKTPRYLISFTYSRKDPLKIIAGISGGFWYEVNNMSFVLNSLAVSLLLHNQLFNLLINCCISQTDSFNVLQWE